MFVLKSLTYTHTQTETEHIVVINYILYFSHRSFMKIVSQLGKETGTGLGAPLEMMIQLIVSTFYSSTYIKQSL